jgi:hypothetical protein
VAALRAGPLAPVQLAAALGLKLGRGFRAVVARRLARCVASGWVRKVYRTLLPNGALKRNGPKRNESQLADPDRTIGSTFRDRTPSPNLRLIAEKTASTLLLWW